MPTTLPSISLAFVVASGSNAGVAGTTVAIFDLPAFTEWPACHEWPMLQRTETGQQDQSDRRHNADTDVVVNAGADGFCKSRCHDRW